MLSRYLQSTFACCLCLLVLGGLPAQEPIGQPSGVRIAMAGDSTMATYKTPPADRPDLTGWGQVFGEFFNDSVSVVNHAQSGASSKSFRARGLWERVLASQPDYVFIQFGHNDGPGKGDRSTDPKTEFRDNLRRFIDEAAGLGAQVVLVTPVARRTFGDNGKISSSLQPYVDAVHAVATEKNIPVIDLNRSSTELFDRLGDSGSADLSPAASDRSHFSSKGALAMAKLVIDAIPAAVPELQSSIK